MQKVTTPAGLQAQATVSRAEVEMAALGKVPAGKIQDVELEVKDVWLVWSSDLRAPDNRVTRVFSCSGATAECVLTYTGTGIPEDRLPRMFDRFFRGVPSHSNGVDGSGLGLGIAQWIATAHSEPIEITSQPGELTRVTVCLQQEQAGRRLS